MCLSSVTTIYPNPSELITDGWKSFGGSGSQLLFQMQKFGGKSDVPLDVWLKAESLGLSIKATDGKSYEPGFHVYSDDFQNKTGYRRVFVRRISCAGNQETNKCVIAQEMYVPSDPNGWPPQPTPAPPTPTVVSKKKWGRISGRKA